VGQNNFLGCLSDFFDRKLFICVNYNRRFSHALLVCFLQLNSKNLGPAGPIDDHADPDQDETTYNALNLPGARREDDGSRRSKVEVLTMAVSFSSTGREWATVSGEGLHVYSLDEDMIFDPIGLTEEITPALVQTKVKIGEFSLALRMALHLNESSLIREVMDHVPFDAIPLVVRSFERAEPSTLERLLQNLAQTMAKSPHIEYYLRWSLGMLQTHGLYVERHRGIFMRSFRALHKSIQMRYDDLIRVSDGNQYMLEFLFDHGMMARDAVEIQ
jgi:periodic tryptophan protein 2